jgi:hypothetical protein
MSDKIIKLGLGEAVQRLIRVELAAAMGVRLMPEALAEANMLRDTLNQYDLEIAFDCNDDGVPDTVEIYQQAAETSCCRLVKPDQVMTRRSRKDSSRRASSGSSRRQG